MIKTKDRHKGTKSQSLKVSKRIKSKTKDRHKGTKSQRESKSKQRIDTKAQSLKENQNQNKG